MLKSTLTPADILPVDAYNKIRAAKRGEIMEAKKNRRMNVGPYATFYFENYDTMWLQVQEMLRIEKGGDAQLEDELRAYNPLIPKGKELVATVMFEINDPVKRASELAKLGGVENQMELRVGDEIIRAQAEQDLDYTSVEGKASSVQFVHFPFTDAQIGAFLSPATETVLAITHPSYAHMAIMPQAVKQALSGDFN